MSEAVAVTLFGIPNCDQVKKARAWLNAASVAYAFHDVKKQPLDTSVLQRWIARTGWQPLVNKQGTTWRGLDAAHQAAVVDATSAIALLQAHPSVMKRPVLECGETVAIGFDAQRYQSIFPSAASA